MGNQSAESDVKQDSLNTTAARNAKQEHSIGFLKGELTELKVNAAEKGEAIEKMEKANDRLRSWKRKLVLGQRMSKKRYCQ